MRRKHKISAFRVFLAICVAALMLPGNADGQSALEGEQHIIDYVVSYTPEALANEEDGTVAAMNARIARAFSGANDIFRDSNTGVQLRLVAAVQLSINNTSTTLDGVISELTPLPEIIQNVRAYQADSYALIVEQMLPGAYAGIPISLNQARTGGSTFFGRRNFSGFTFAHETGHTLGAFHDRPADAPATISAAPEGPHGNHFIGLSGQHWRTVMSVKLNSYRATDGQIIPTIQSNRFSSPEVFFDGVPTGIAGQQDVVSTIRYYAPYVSQAGELRAAPPQGEDPPADPMVPIPPADDNDDDMDPPIEELQPTVTLQRKPARSGNNVIVKALCAYESDGSPAVGKKLTLRLSERGRVKAVKRTTCSASGIATFKFSKDKYKRGLSIVYPSHPLVKVGVPFDRNLFRR